MAAVVLLGPTAAGKTHLLQETCDGTFEVIVADALQAYRGMDIGTAKPDTALRARLPHHLLDILEPSQQYTVGEFVRRAEEAVRDISARGLVPVISGGSAYYLRSLIYGLPGSPPGDLGVREALRDEERRRGLEELYRELCDVDPKARVSIHPTDRYRVLRALEIHRVTGRPRSDFAPPTRPRADMRFHLLGVRVDPASLARRIETRVHGMFRAGLVEEVRQLLQRGYGERDPGMRGIGYREFLLMRLGCGTLAGTRDLVTANTTRFAKRQRTFFRSFGGVQWIEPGQAESLRAALRLASVVSGD